jgi:hypothetical protein
LSDAPSHCEGDKTSNDDDDGGDDDDDDDSGLSSSQKGRKRAMLEVSDADVNTDDDGDVDVAWIENDDFRNL